MDKTLQSKVQDILAKHYAEILSELDEVVDSDSVELTITVESAEVENEFKCKIG